MLARTYCEHFEEYFSRSERKNINLNANKKMITVDQKITKKVIVYMYKFELTRLSFSHESLHEQKQVVDV